MAEQQSSLSKAAGVGSALSDLFKPKRAAPFAKAVKGGVGGAAGAAIGMALEHKEGIKKSAVAITAALMLPVLFLTMLPGLTFGDLSENSGVLNSDTFEKKTISFQHIVTDIYLDGHLVTIEKDKTKTKSSTRTLPLVKPFEAALIALKEQQRQQQKLCGNAYNKDYLEYVLRDKMGNRIKPGYVSQHFRIVLTKNNLKLIRFHDLRHSCASLLYANGVDLKAIQEWLGHSTITTTANTYTHFDFNKKVQSAEAIMGNYPAQIEQKREG